MAKMSKVYVSVELADGTVHEDVRVTLQDQLQWSKTARARRMDPEDQSTGSAFVAWCALRRNGLYDGSWEEFSTGGALGVTAEEVTPEDGEDGEGDPTNRAA